MMIKRSHFYILLVFLIVGIKIYSSYNSYKNEEKMNIFILQQKSQIQSMGFMDSFDQNMKIIYFPEMLFSLMNINNFLEFSEKHCHENFNYELKKYQEAFSSQVSGNYSEPSLLLAQLNKLNKDECEF